MTAWRRSERKSSSCSLVKGFSPARRLRWAGLASSAAITAAEKRSTDRKRPGPMTTLTADLLRSMRIPPCMLSLYSFGLPRARKTSRSRAPDNRLVYCPASVLPDACPGSLLHHDCPTDENSQAAVFEAVLAPFWAFSGRG